MYSRAYKSVIPLESYLLVGNLSDFTASVIDSMRMTEILLPLSTIAAWFAERHYYRKISIPTKRKNYVATICFTAIVSSLFLVPNGGLSKTIDNMQNANYYSCATPMYTVFTNIKYYCTTLKRTLKLRFISSQLVPRSSNRPIWDVVRTCFPIHVHTS